MNSAPAVIQPLLFSGGRIILGGGIGKGTRCIKVDHSDKEWKPELVWKNTKFSPGFNDIVQHGDFVYGLDAGRVVCLEAATGKQRWKDGSYGAGELLLVGDQLLVQAEDGHLAVVAASPDEWQEIAGCRRWTARRGTIP